MNKKKIRDLVNETMQYQI